MRVFKECLRTFTRMGWVKTGSLESHNFKEKETKMGHSTLQKDPLLTQQRVSSGAFL